MKTRWEVGDVLRSAVKMCAQISSRSEKEVMVPCSMG